MQTIDQYLGAAGDPYWQRSQVRCGKLEPTGSSLCFVTINAGAGGYSNAQIDDYQGLPRRRFLWRPPLRLTVRARFSHAAGGAGAGLRGTAGFGFWNDPFLMTGPRIPTLPRAAWFFYASPPSDMKLDLHVPGHGWKAATIDAMQPAALILAPLALPALLLMKRPALYRKLWPSIQRALKVAEAEVDTDMTEWHTYDLDWSEARVSFYLDGQPLLDAPSPRGPLGFVMWLDNQFMVATAQGRFRWGLLDAPGRQWMEIEHLSIIPQKGSEQGAFGPGTTRRNGRTTTEN